MCIWRVIGVWSLWCEWFYWIRGVGCVVRCVWIGGGFFIVFRGRVIIKVVVKIIVFMIKNIFMFMNYFLILLKDF